MEKSTQKFLSVLLSLAILFSFPIAAQAAEDSYESTFTGTYTAPIDARNVLVSGNDAAVSEWYGDRVNMGGKTYSVRQNQYGLNKDGNMIKMDLNQTYTIWLAQYGVASFVFKAPQDGNYILEANDNETYGHSPYYYDLGVVKTVSLPNGTTKNECDYLYYDEDCHSNVFSALAGETVYVFAGTSHEKDFVYDVKVTPWTAEKCPHKYNLEQVYGEGCKYTYIYECTLCKATKSEDDEYHDYTYTYNHEAENCQDYTSGVKKCRGCGRTEDFYREQDGSHVAASKVIDEVGSSYIFYKCLCAVCGKRYFVEEISPCYNKNTDEYEHSFGSLYDDVPCGQKVTCTKCGCTAKGNHDWGEVQVASKNGYCTTYAVYCAKCGESYTETDHDDGTGYWDNWEYVQVTPQHDNVCGTYNYACAGCGALKFDEPLTCHSNVTEFTDCLTTNTCARCNNIEQNAHHYFNDGEAVAPTCTSQGGTLYTCEDCGATELKDAVPATGHNFGSNNPTCLTCGTANPNYIAPTQPTQPTQPPTQPTQPAPQPTEATTAATVKKPKKASISKLTSGEKFIKAAWKKLSGVTGYQVQYSTDKKFKKNTKTVTVKGASATSVTIKSLKSSTKYYVRVRAYDKAKINGKVTTEYGAWSKTKDVKTKDKELINKKQKNSSVKKVAKGKKAFTLTWKKVKNISGYEIQYSTDKKFKKNTKSVTAKKNATSKTIKKLTPKKKYYVRLRTYKYSKLKGKTVKICSKWSPVKTVTVKK